MVKELQDLLYLRNISSTKEKIQFLSQFKNNELVKRLLQIALDNNIITNLASKKINKKLKEDKFDNVKLLPFSNKYNSLFILLDYIVSDECTGTDENIYQVQQFLKNYSDEEKNILVDFIIKKPRIGINISNANKAIPNLLIDFAPMSAYNIDKIKIEDSDDLYYATMKLDGHRFIVKYDENGIVAYSRNGKIIKNCNEFLKKLNLPVGYYFDGEILGNGEFKHSKERFLYTSTLLGADEEITPEKLTYNIFDIIPIHEFENKQGKSPYSERRKLLNKIQNNNYQIIVPVLGIFKLEDENLSSLFERVTNEGNEGLMLNRETGLYQCKRTKDILKLKGQFDVDLRCVDVLEGNGKFKNNTGSLAVEYKGNIVKVPSMKDELRLKFWQNKDSVIGKIITVRYCEETQNKEGQYSLRFPRFIEIREDKCEPSIN